MAETDEFVPEGGSKPAREDAPPDVQRELERLRAENAELRAGKSERALRLQVSAKGGVSLYGIRRFPITFYLEEWQRILGMADEIQSFLHEHEQELKRKGSGS